MKPRKIVLLASCAVLLVIAIAQWIAAGKNPVKIIKMKENIDEIRVSRPGEEFNLKLDGDVWVVGNKKYAGNENACISLVERISEIKLLDKVARGDSEGILAKYNLNKENVIIAKAYADGVEKRTLYIGKASSTGIQSYIMLDNSKDIYLANGNLNSEFGKPVNDFRSRAALSLEKDKMLSVKIDYLNGDSWSMNRDLSTGKISLDKAGETIDADETNALSWFEGSASLMANIWCDDNAEPKGEKILKVSYTLVDKKVSLDIWQAKDSDGDNEYYGRTSESPYLFKLAQYSVQKYQKHPEDFGK